VSRVDEDENRAPRKGIVGIDLRAIGRSDAGRRDAACGVARKVALEKAKSVRTTDGKDGRRM